MHTCHILPPSEIDWGCVWLSSQAQEGNIYFTELAERVEYGNYDDYDWPSGQHRPPSHGPWPSPPPTRSNNNNNNIIIIIIIINNHHDNNNNNNNSSNRHSNNSNKNSNSNDNNSNNSKSNDNSNDNNNVTIIAMLIIM